MSRLAGCLSSCSSHLAGHKNKNTAFSTLSEPSCRALRTVCAACAARAGSAESEPLIEEGLRLWLAVLRSTFAISPQLQACGTCLVFLGEGTWLSTLAGHGWLGLAQAAWHGLADSEAWRLAILSCWGAEWFLPGWKWAEAGCKLTVGSTIVKRAHCRPMHTCLDCLPCRSSCWRGCRPSCGGGKTTGRPTRW